jgi:lactoylglutathione lyase
MVRLCDVVQSLHFHCGALGLKEKRRIKSEKGRVTPIFLEEPSAPMPNTDV